MVLGRSIRQLIESVHIPSLAILLPAARQLVLYYFPSRYPVGPGDGTPHEAFSSDQSSGALRLADEIVAAAARTINELAADE